MFLYHVVKRVGRYIFRVQRAIAEAKQRSQR
jgi:hypothetical protein